jgi:hypothetical protein
MKARAPPQNVLSLPQSKCNLGGREERGGVGGGGVGAVPVPQRRRQG